MSVREDDEGGGVNADPAEQSLDTEQSPDIEEPEGLETGGASWDDYPLDEMLNPRHPGLQRNGLPSARPHRLRPDAEAPPTR